MNKTVKPKFKIGSKVQVKRRNGVIFVGKIADFWASKKGDWVTLKSPGSTPEQISVRPSQLQAA